MTVWGEIIAALIVALPTYVGAYYAIRVHRQVKTPSGDTIGAVAERTHDLTSADLALTKDIHRTIQNGHDK